MAFYFDNYLVISFLCGSAGALLEVFYYLKQKQTSISMRSTIERALTFGSSAIIPGFVFGVFLGPLLGVVNDD